MHLARDCQYRSDAEFDDVSAKVTDSPQGISANSNLGTRCLRLRKERDTVDYCVNFRFVASEILHIRIPVHLKKVYEFHYSPEVRRSIQEVKVPRLRDKGPGWW